MRVLILLMMLLWTSPVWAVTLPTLPTANVDVTMPTITGNTYTVTSCGTLQSTLNTAAAANITLNHVINVTAGLTCSGSIGLPSRVGATGWVILRSANHASLPAGTRVSPASASNMFQVAYGESPNIGAITVLQGASHYRLVGISMVTNNSIPINQVLMEMGYGNNGFTNTGYIIIDRCLIRDISSPSDYTKQTRSGVMGEAQLGHTALIDSYVANIKNTTGDVYAWLSTSNPGPILLRNNYLEATGMGVMFCGSQPRAQAEQPTNITMQRNTVAKASAWWTDPTWNTKTLLEFKCGKKVLVEGNIFENIGWAREQGWAFRFTVRAEHADHTWAESSDITFRYNLIRNINNVFQMFGSDDNGNQCTPACISMHSKRWNFHDNLIYGLSFNAGGGAPEGAMFRTTFGGQGSSCTDPTPTCGIEDFRFAHNTIDDIGGEGQWCLISTHARGLDFQDNLINNNAERGIWNCNSGGAVGQALITNVYAATWTYNFNTVANVNNGDFSSAFPQFSNFYPANISSVPFTNRATRDYTLTAHCPGQSNLCASDSTDKGVNWTAFNAAQAGTGGVDTTPPAAPTGVTITQPYAPINLHFVTQGTR